MGAANPTIGNFSASFLNKLDGVVNDGDSEYEITLSISAGQKNVVIEPEYIKEFAIVQDYNKNYRDTARLYLELTPAQALVISGIRQGLKANLLIYLKNGTVESPNVLIHGNVYHMIVRNSENFELLQGPKTDIQLQSAGQDDELITMEFELISERDYKLRKEKFSCIMHDVTMEETLMTIAQILRFEKVYIAPPDNKEVYTNMIIPALSSIEDVFGFLQNSNGYGGVYSSGLNYYIQHDILYIVPAQDPNPNDFKVNFYNVGKGAYVGASRFHSTKKNVLNVAINSEVDVYDISQISIENIGSWYCVSSPNKVLDRTTTLDPEGAVAIQEDVIESITLISEELGAMKDSFTQDFHIGNNLNVPTQKLYSNGMATIDFSWEHACPYLIRPNYEIHYLSDTKSGVKDTRCMVSSMIYSFTQVGTSEKIAMACTARISLVMNKLIPDK